MILIKPKILEKLNLNLVVAGILVVVMVLVVSANYLYTAGLQRSQALESLRSEAQAIAAQFISLRSFIAANQGRINYDSSGNFEFKHLNPAAVGKGVADLFQESSVYSVKQTRLAPRNLENVPDDFEEEALRRFADEPGLTEIFAPDEVSELHVYRYLLPMYATQACLECHGDPVGSMDISGYPREGLKEGQLAGALSITVPAERFYATLWTQKVGYLTFTVALLFVTVLILYWLLNSLVVRPISQLSVVVTRVGQGDFRVDPQSITALGEVQNLADEFGAMTQRLQSFYEELERRVRERTRELQEANRQLAQANRLQSEFLSNMTHEIRTPLTSIISFTELLLDQVPGKINAQQEQALMDVQESGQQLLGLVNDLLDLTRIEAGRMVLCQEAVDPEDLLRSSARTMTPLAQKAGLTLEVNLTNELPLISADPNRLRQVIINLVGNAIKFTPHGGRVSLGAEVHGDMLALSVSDTGIGIRPEDQELIFEKFRQVDGSATRQYGGAGVGLAVSKHLVTMHGGKIWVTSKEGEGSTFIFTVPLIKGLEDGYAGGQDSRCG